MSCRNSSICIGSGLTQTHFGPGLESADGLGVSPVSVCRLGVVLLKGGSSVSITNTAARQVARMMANQPQGSSGSSGGFRFDSSFGHMAFNRHATTLPTNRLNAPKPCPPYARLFAACATPAYGASFFADLCDAPFSCSLLSVPDHGGAVPAHGLSPAHAARIGRLRDSTEQAV
jgi:hypothetical protein